jgi:hypothetical protein
MSKLRLLGVTLGVLVLLYGGYTMVFEGESSGFVPAAGGIVIIALAMGVFDTNKQIEKGDE